MPTIETIRRITTQARTEGVEAAASALNKLAASSDGVTVATDRQQRAMLTNQAALDRASRAYMPLVAAQEKLAALSRQLELGQASGRISQEASNALYAQAVDRLTGYTRALEQAARAEIQARAAQESASQATAAANQQVINRRLNVQTMPGSDRAADFEAAAASADRLRAKYSPLFAAQTQYRTTLTEISEAAKAGVLSENERAAAMTRTKDAFAAQVKAMKAGDGGMGKQISEEYRSQILGNIAIQGKDALEQVLAGSSPIRAAMMQLPAAASIAAQGGMGVGDVVGGLAEKAKGLAETAVSAASKIPLIGYAIGGVAAAATLGLAALSSYQSQQKELERSLSGIGRASGASVGGINALAPEAAQAAGVSTAAAREMAGAFAATGRIGTDVYGGLIKQTHDFALATGTDATEATKLFAEAFADPAKGALDLDKGLGFLNDTMLQNIRRMQESGDRLGAQKLLLQGVATATEGAASKLGFFARGWAEFSKNSSNEIQAVGGFVARGFGLDDAESRLKALQGQLEFRTNGNAFGKLFSFDIEQIKADISKVQAEIDKATAAGRQTAANQNSREIGELTRQLEPTNVALQASQRIVDKLRASITDPMKFGLGPVQLAETQNAFDRLSATTRSMREDIEKFGNADIAAAARAAGLQNKLATDRANPVDRQIAERSFQAQEELRKGGRDQIPTAQEVLAKYNEKLNNPDLDVRELQAIVAQREVAMRLVAERDGLTKVLGTDIDTIRKEAETRAVRAQNISAYMDRVIGAESGGDPTARNTRSTATGLGQFIDGTWLELFKRQFPDRASGMTDPEILSRRTNRDDSIELIRAFTEQNARALEKAGLATSDRNLYLSHFAGSQGAINLLNADRGVSAESILGSAAARANPTIIGGGRTAGSVIDYAERTIARSAPNIRAAERDADIARSQISLTDQTAEAEARRQKVQELLNDEMQRGTALGKSFATTQDLLKASASQLTPEMEAQRKVIIETAVAYGKAQAGLENSKLGRDLLFERGQIGRTDIDQTVASRLRGTGLGMDSAEAEAIRMNDALRQTRSLATDAFGSFAQDIAHGTNAMTAMSSMLGRISDKLLSMATDKLISNLFGSLLGGSGSGGGGLMSLFGGGSGATGGVSAEFGWADGGYTGAGGRHEPAGIVHRGEYVMDQDTVRRFGLGTLEAMRMGRAGYDAGGYVGMIQPDTIAARPNAANANGGAPPINFIDQRAAGSGDIEPTTQRRTDGGFDVIIRSVEGRMGQRASAGRGPFRQAAGGVAYRQG